MKIVPVLVLSLSVAACASGAGTPPPAAPPPVATTTASAAPAAATPEASTPRAREERARATIDRLASRNFGGAREWFDGTMRDHLSVEKLRDTWSEVESELGAHQSHTFNGATRVKGYAALEYDLAFEKGHVTARVVFDDDGMVAGLFLTPQSR